MKTEASSKNRQGGAVAVVVGISMVMLIGFLALVLDLGHLYIAKTELQNAADAAALAGAKELKGTALGVTRAITMAQQLAGRNYYDLGSKKTYDTTDSETQNDVIDIWVGNCPEDTCMSLASTITTDAAAANKYFIKVHTRQRDLAAWFAPIFNLVTGGNYSITSTFGMAVAGRYLIDITPLAMCALDRNKCPDKLPGGTCGYEPGKAYDVYQVNYGGGGINPGTIYWLDPLATTNNCTVTNTDDGRPFICQGKAAINTGIGTYVYTNTGKADPFLAALDSRFGEPASQSQCDPLTAPPDENIKEYLYSDPNVRAWMNPEPQPTTQTSTVTSGKNIRPVITDNDGVLWSFVRPEGNPILPPGRSANTSAPPYATSSLTPYTDKGNPLLYTAQTNGKPERRILNLVVVDCPSDAGGNCRQTTVVGIGRFLMQRKANKPSNSQGIYLEFGEFVPGGPNVSEYKLYR